MIELVGKRIKELRLLNNLSEEQVAEYLGVSTKKYSLIEKGIDIIGYDVILKISQLFGVTAKDILQVLEDAPNRYFRAGGKPDSFNKIFDMLDFFYANKGLYMYITQNNEEDSSNACQQKE